MFVVYFSFWYVVFVCSDDEVGDDGVALVGVRWGSGIFQGVFYFMCECCPVCFPIVSVATFLLL